MSSSASDSSLESNNSQHSVALASRPLFRHGGHHQSRSSHQVVNAAMSLPMEVWDIIMLLSDVEDMASLCLVSRMHHTISRTLSFQARYFLQQNSRCSAIFEASRHSRLFTSDLLNTLLDMGAIMSRDFVYSFSKAYMNARQLHQRAEHWWTKRTSLRAYVAVLDKAEQLYGETMKLVRATSERDLIHKWANCAQRSSVLEEEIKESLVIGRYAPYDKRYNSVINSLNAILRKHPELFRILTNNGYQFEKLYPEVVINDLLSEIDAKEEDLYRRIVLTLESFPTYTASASTCKQLLSLSSRDIQGGIRIPKNEIDLIMLSHNDGIGAVSAPFKVLKRLHNEGKAFQDLNQYLKPYLKWHSHGKPFAPQCVPGYRILYRYFPQLLVDVREDMGRAFAKAWQTVHSQSTGPEDYWEDQKIMQEGLFERLIELNLSPAQVARILSAPGMSMSIILPAFRVGLFGVDWIKSLPTIFQTLIGHCIDSPLAGKQLRELADVAIKCNKEQDRDQRCRLDATFFADQVNTVLSACELDLDLLRPDDDRMLPTAFRSPIGWMVSGSCVADLRHGPRLHTSLQPQDPYDLIPEDRAWTSFELTFTLTRDGSKLSLLEDIVQVREDSNDEIVAAQTDKTSTLCGITSASIGWSCIGYVDDATGENVHSNDLGVVKEAVKEDAEDDWSTDSESSQLSQLHDIIRADDRARVMDADQTTMKLLYPTVKKTVHLYTCAQHLPCLVYERQDEIEGKETALALMEILDADSPAIRDVLLGHALANGNVELVSKIMAGRYPEERWQEGPVLPTLSHLLILQKLQRRPLKIFLEAILRGAPFKRGYVKSLPSQPQEAEIHRRQEWYAEMGYRDDRWMTSLIWKKQKLLQKSDHKSVHEEEDMSIKVEVLPTGEKVVKLGEGLVRFRRSMIDELRIEADLHRRYEGIGDPDSDDLDLDLDLNLPIPIIKETIKTRFKHDEIQFSLTSDDLFSRQKRLILWRQHLELLQWFEDRDAALERAALAQDGKRISSSKIIPSNPFSQGLQDMIKKVKGLEKKMDKYYNREINREKQALSKAVAKAEEVARLLDWQSQIQVDHEAKKGCRASTNLKRQRKAHMLDRDIEYRQQTKIADIKKGKRRCKTRPLLVDILVEDFV